MNHSPTPKKFSPKTEELKLWVEKLGSMTPEEIRKLMQEEGVKGEIACSLTCLLAEFLKKKIGERVYVFYKGIINHDSSSTVTEIEDLIPVPDNVRQFLLNFDAAHYPELIDQNAPWGGTTIPLPVALTNLCNNSEL